MLKVGIIGLGLIGGSLAKALKMKLNAKIAAFNRSETSLISAFNEGVIDIYSTEDLSIFSDCDYIFICTPVDKILSYVDRLLPYIKKDCIITDGGSTKSNICNEMSKKYKDIIFIGGHPMAGSEKTGYLASKEFLFENAFYILTPNKNVLDSDVQKLSDIVKKIGAIPIVLDSSYHDYIVAAISHIPHIIASSLVNMVKELDGKDSYMHSLAAGGFKDITRIASGSPEVWTGICEENKNEILKVLQSFKNIINQFEKLLLNNDFNSIYNFFESSRDYRNSFSENNKSIIPKTYDIFLNISDTPGIIVSILKHLSDNNINIKNIGIINNRDFENGIFRIAFGSNDEKEKSLTLFKKLNLDIVSK